MTTVIGFVSAEKDPKTISLGTRGTANYVAKYSGSTTLVNSQIYDNGSGVGIGTSTPLAGMPGVKC
jgi:hypothetical protein